MMKTFNKYLESYFIRDPKHKKIYELDGNYIFTNSISIVVMPIGATRKQLDRFKDLSIDIVKYKDVENDLYNKNRIFILQVKNFIDRFKNDHFCESLIDPKEKDNYIILNESYSINKTEMRKIQKLINGKGIFTSKENSQAISLTGKNGYAWLLACKTF